MEERRIKFKKEMRKIKEKTRRKEKQLRQERMARIEKKRELMRNLWPYVFLNIIILYVKIYLLDTY